MACVRDATTTVGREQKILSALQIPASASSRRRKTRSARKFWTDYNQIRPESDCSASANGLDSVSSSAMTAAGEVLGVRQNSGFVFGDGMVPARLIVLVSCALSWVSRGEGRSTVKARDSDDRQTVDKKQVKAAPWGTVSIPVAPMVRCFSS